MQSYTLPHLADSSLLDELREGFAGERRSTVWLLVRIAEVEARGLYLPAGYDSMLAFCVGEYQQTEDVALVRIRVARAARKCPALFDALADGRLHLTAALKLAPHITPELAACGFEVEPFGRKTVAIKAAPAGLATVDVQQLLGELLEGLERETQAISLAKLRERIAASVACHAAIKINMHLDQAKMVWLIDELQKTQYPMSCPHGRPIVLRYERNEILKAFKRI